jgi:16S rRNA processing protein RimM
VTNASPEYVIVGRLRRAHGISGELVVEPITDAPDAIFAPGRRVFAGTSDGRLDPKRPPLIVKGRRPHKGGWIVSFEGIADRDESERWRDRYLLLPESELEPPADDEIFVHELTGMRVDLADGTIVGTIVEMWELPQGLVMDVKREKGSVMIPYGERVVRSVDKTNRIVVIDPPDGLLE